MECLELDCSDFFLDDDAIDFPLEIHLESNSSAGAKAAPDPSRHPQLHRSNAPDPPPLPGTSYDARRSSRKAKACRRVPEGVVDSWDKLFLQGYQSELRVSTDDGTEILSHSCVLVSTALLIFSCDCLSYYRNIADLALCKAFVFSSSAECQISCPESYAGGS